VIAAPDQDTLVERIRAVAQWGRQHTTVVAPPGDEPPPAFLLWRQAARTEGSP